MIPRLPTPFRRARSALRPRGDRGFTLLEAMITVTCIGILGALAIPRLQGYVRESRLNAAKPILMEIAARQRMYKIETGSYCCSGYNQASEDQLASLLPVTLADVGDFCFLWVCPTGNGCTGTSLPASSVLVGGTGAEFEVWAGLRDTTGTTNVAVNGRNCTPATGKANPTGWVRSSGSGLAGRSGQVVVLRYPPPANAGGTGVQWQDGISVSNALRP